MFTSEPPQFDAAGVPRAPCSGQLMGATTCIDSLAPLVTSLAHRFRYRDEEAS